MSTYVHGIGASENIDSSGEIVSISGLDISSLDKDGVLNWEHKSDQPAQVVGKILKARKIFSDADCEDEHQLYFWNRCKVPYLYVMGELTDDYTDSAREVAGKFRYDQDRKHQNERPMMNFSVEGSKISKEGIVVSRSIARKITITILPCNKAAVAEMVSIDPAKPKKNAIDELFKTEAVEIEVLIPKQGSKLWDLLKKEDPSKHAAKLGIKPFQKDMAGGQTSNLASTALSGVGPTSSGGVIGGEGMMRSEMKKTAGVKPAAKPPTIKPPTIRTGNSGFGKIIPVGMGKALDAGSALSGPANLSGGAALGKEHLEKDASSISMNGEEMEKTAGQSGVDPQSGRDPGTPAINMPLRSKDSRIGIVNPTAKVGAMKKSAWLMRAEHAYHNWEKREFFENFMQNRMPHLTKMEIKVIGQTMLMQKAIEMEKSLTKMFGAGNNPINGGGSFVAKKEKK